MAVGLSAQWVINTLHVWL